MSRVWDFLTVVVAALAIVIGVRSLLPDSDNAPRDREVTDWESFAEEGRRLGAEDAKVVVVEFGDYECPYCKRLYPHLEAFLETFPNDVALVYRHFPLDFHPNAHRAARIAECAGSLGRFEAMHHVLNTVPTLEGLDLLSIAGDAGITDPAPFVECSNAVDEVPAIRRDIELGNGLPVLGTPTVLIDGLLLGLPPDSARLFDLVQERLAASDIGGNY